MEFTENEIELERNLKIPAPLDPHIANLAIRTGSNNPTDFFDLLLSANFGEEYVFLGIGSEQIEVKLSIRKAEIVFNTVNCDLHLIANGETEGWCGHQTQLKQTSSDVSANAHLVAGASPIELSARAKIESQVSGSTNQNTVKEFNRGLLPWRIVGNDTVQFGFLEDFDQVLSGRILDEGIAVRVTPQDHNQKIGVLARVRVRERWLEISEVSTAAESGKIRNFLNSLAKNQPEMEKRRQLFSKLLAHLIAIELQAEGEQRSATLAASAIIYSPVNMGFHGPNLPNERSAISVDPTSIDNFIASSPGQEEEVLREIGVDLGQPEDDEVDIADIQLLNSISQVWQNAGNRRLLTFEGRIQVLEKALSYSFGLEVKLGQAEDNQKTAFLPFYQLEVSDTPHETKEPNEIIEFLGGDWKAEEIAVYLGILTKGEEAFNIAQLMGYEFLYPAFQRRFRKFAYKSGYGNLISYSQLQRALAANSRHFFAGLRLRSAQLFLVNEFNPELPVLD